MSRDTWGGDDQRPLSFNRWNYTNGNPVNNTDPTGLMPGGPRTSCSKDRVDLNPEYVEKQVHNLFKSYWLDTYAAAGIAVQCWEVGFIDVLWPWSDTIGPAQASYSDISTPYGEGGGLRCYRLNFGGSIQCFTQEQIKNCPSLMQVFQLEPLLDRNDWDDAATLMKRRIQHAIDTCPRNGQPACADTDKFIIAGMAQNGPGFRGMDGSVKKLSEKDRTDNYKYDWVEFFHRAGPKNTSWELKRFVSAIAGFQNLGWTIPIIDFDYIGKLIK